MSSALTSSVAERKATLTQPFGALADERCRRTPDVVERADARLPVELLAKALADDVGILAYHRDDHTVSSTQSTADALAVVETEVDGSQ